MNRIDRCFADLRARGEKALVCFLMCGDPDYETTARLVERIVDDGADVVELGIPFSDPLADGPSIQAAGHRALENGASVRGCFDCLRHVRERCDAPVVFMTYYNPVQKYGLDAFARDAADAGADGVIMTDLPPEEADAWKKAADAAELATIFLLAPTSTKERVVRAANMASGFIYCVSRTGVTGARSEVPLELTSLIETIKSESDLPVVVGFGISKPEHVAQVTECADGAVVGSALIDVIGANADPAAMIAAAGDFVRSLKGGVAARE